MTPHPFLAEAQHRTGTTSLVSRRIAFLLAVAYWAQYHASISRGLWVAQFEGNSWN